MELFLSALNLDIIKEFLPLGDALLGAFFTLLTAGFTYMMGKRKRDQEVVNLQAEKLSIEAASGVSTAEAARVISSAAAATVGPLVERVKQQSDEIKSLTEKIIDLGSQIEHEKTVSAQIKAENELLKHRFRLQGETVPELPKQLD